VSRHLPKAPAGVTFARRHVLRRELGLTPSEVVVLEVVSDWPTTVEADWNDFEDAIEYLVVKGHLRPRLLADFEDKRRGGPALHPWRMLLRRQR